MAFPLVADVLPAFTDLLCGFFCRSVASRDKLAKTDGGAELAMAVGPFPTEEIDLESTWGGGSSQLGGCRSVLRTHE